MENNDTWPIPTTVRQIRLCVVGAGIVSLSVSSGVNPSRPATVPWLPPRQPFASLLSRPDVSDADHVQDWRRKIHESHLLISVKKAPAVSSWSWITSPSSSWPTCILHSSSDRAATIATIHDFLFVDGIGLRLAVCSVLNLSICKTIHRQYIDYGLICIHVFCN